MERLSLTHEAHLTSERAYEIQKAILENRLSEEEILSLFASLDRPLSPEEFLGFYEASADAMVKVPTTKRAIDTCGTGGDGLDTFNISTTSALLLAALDVPVAKHGNRSSSSKCGSVDVLEALGITITLDAAGAAECLEETGFCFMFAPVFHPGFKNATAARKKFGKRTYFNFLGPLLNPAEAPFRLVGTSDAQMIDLLGTTLTRTGIEKAWVVHGTDGMDEISPTSETLISEFTPGQVARQFSINPGTYGLEPATIAGLAGGNASENAEILRAVLGGSGTSAQRNAVILNVAGGLAVAGKCDSIESGVHVAEEALQEGLGLEKLEQVITVSKALG